jgi:hypothetical protein
MQGIGTNSTGALTGAPAKCETCGAYNCTRHHGHEKSAPHAEFSSQVTQGNEGTRERGKTAVRGLSGSSKKSSTPSSPSVTEDKAPEVEQLLALYAANRLEPDRVELPPLPDSATGTMRAVAEFYGLVLSLRVDAGIPDASEVPFACGWVADKIGRPKKSVHRALAQLEVAGVLRRAGSLPGRGMRGTHLWGPARQLVAVRDPSRRAA